MKQFNPRFEHHVCKRLKQVKEGRRSRYEHVRKKHLADATSEAIENLATSWGPFQIIRVKDLRGDSSLYWVVKWIAREYGNYIRQGKYKDAFHFHNAGTPFPRNGKPRTYDTKYVERGMGFIEYFNRSRE